MNIEETTTKELLQRLDELGDLISEKRHDIEHFDKSEHASVDAYREMLEEAYEDVEVCGMLMCPVRILENLDPIAFDCGFNDYVDSLDPSEFAEYWRLEEELEALEAEESEVDEEINNRD